ncbi:MAG: O-antigen ligase family protein [Paludibacteraceae bacterium]|nr:O-antigen ligase family protein [Paludibacteraceae bacterium]
MNINIGILKDDERYGKFDQVIDVLFCISSTIFAFAIPFQFRFTPWIAHWFFAVLIFKLYYVMRSKEKLISINLKDSVALLSLGCYGIWTLLSTFWSLHPDTTHRLAIDWLSSLLIIPGIYIFSSKRLPINLMMKAYVCGCTALIIYILTDLTDTALNGDIRFFLYYRLEIMNHIESIAYHHIYLGFIIAVSIFISSKFLFDAKTSIWEKLLYVTHGVLALYLLAIDNSRIVTLAIFISIFLFFVNQIKENKKLGIALLVVFAAIIISFFVFPTRIGESIMKIAESGNADDPRFHIWSAIAAGLKDVPFLGYGYSAVDDIYADLYQKAEFWEALNKHYTTHNQFLEAFFTLGYIGIVLVITFLVGIIILIKRTKSLSLVSMIILLLVSMMFEIPFCYCFSIPLIIAWFTFCHSGKTDMSVELPQYTFVLPTIIAIVFAGIIAFDSYKSIQKYSSPIGEIEVTNYNQRKITKKWLKKYKIKEDNIDMIICKGESGSVHTHKDMAMEIRDYAFTNSIDTLVLSMDYYISEDFSANNMSICVRNRYNSTLMTDNFDLNEKNVWKPISIIIVPSYTKIENLKNNQVEIRRSINTPCIVSLNTYLHNAKTFYNLNGYALFRNMEIKPLNK